MKKKIIIGVFLAIFVLVMMPINSAVEINTIEQINKKDLISMIKDTRYNLKNLIQSGEFEQRIKDIKEAFLDISIQEDISEPKCIIIFSILYFVCSIGIFIAGILSIIFDLLLFFIIAILGGG